MVAKDGVSFTHLQAMVAQKECNCLVHPFDEASDWAEEVSTGKDKTQLLYGVPVSLKDDVIVKVSEFDVCGDGSRCKGRHNRIETALFLILHVLRL